MGLLPGQFIVIGQGPGGDESGWMQLLVFIILAVFWAIGGIIKARQVKLKEREQQETGHPRQGPKTQRPRPTLERVIKQRQAKPQIRTAQEKEGQARPAAPLEPQAAKKPQQQAKPASKSAAEHGREAAWKAKTRIDEAQRATELAIMPREEVEMGTSEQLRTAMLHFEIFGKCVALREGWEHTWMR